MLTSKSTMKGLKYLTYITLYEHCVFFESSAVKNHHLFRFLNASEITCARGSCNVLRTKCT